MHLLPIVHRMYQLLPAPVLLQLRRAQAAVRQRCVPAVVRCVRRVEQCILEVVCARLVAVRHLAVAEALADKRYGLFPV